MIEARLRHARDLKVLRQLGVEPRAQVSDDGTVVSCSEKRKYSSSMFSCYE